MSALESVRESLSPFLQLYIFGMRTCISTKPIEIIQTRSVDADDIFKVMGANIKVMQRRPRKF